MPVEWNDNLVTGIPIIDSQHKHLVAMLTRLGRLRCGKESFQEAFDELKNYAAMHFKTEQDYMLANSYPSYPEHKISHDKFLEKFKEFEDKINIEKNLIKLGSEIYDYAINWMVEHYSKIDTAFAEYIRSRK